MTFLLFIKIIVAIAAYVGLVLLVARLFGFSSDEPVQAPKRNRRTLHEVVASPNWYLIAAAIALGSTISSVAGQGRYWIHFSVAGAILFLFATWRFRAHVLSCVVKRKETNVAQCPFVTSAINDAKNWRCDCGEYCNPVLPEWRWNGREYEHSHEGTQTYFPAVRIPPESWYENNHQNAFWRQARPVEVEFASPVEWLGRKVSYAVFKCPRCCQRMMPYVRSWRPIGDWKISPEPTKQ